MPSLPTLVCKECGHVNEGERVYCHGCGVKLDREILIAKQQEQAATPKDQQRHIKKMLNPRRGAFSATGKTFLQMVILGAFAGALIDAARSPEGALQPKKEELVDTPEIDVILEKLVAAPVGQQKTFREEEVNGYLKRETFKKMPTWITGNVPLRAFVNFDDGACRFNLVGTVASYPIYIGLAAYPAIDTKTGLGGTCTGGYIGRLQIPAPVAKYAGAAIPFLLDSFRHEQELLGQLKSVKAEKGQIILGSGGTSAAPTPGAKPAPPISTPVRPVGL